MELLEHNYINLNFSTFKIPNNLSEEDNNLFSLYKKIAKYYWCLASEYPSEIKLILLINKWNNIPNAMMDITNLVNNKKLAKQLSIFLNRIQARSSDILY